MRKLNTLIITLGLILSLTGCGAASTNSYSSITESSDSTFEGITDGLSVNSNTKYNGSTIDSEESYNYDYTEAVTEDFEIEDTSTQSQSKTNTNLYEDKLIYRSSIEIETLDFEKTYNTLLSMMNEYECRVESEEFYDSSASYSNSYNYNSSHKYINGKTDVLTIRIPSEKYKEFISRNGELGNIISKQSSIENITQQYYDTTAQVEGLEVQLERLQEMLKSTYDVEDMITINSEITNIENRINQLKTEIRTMDMDTTYSYITLTITEVLEYSEAENPVKTNTFIDRLKNQIKETWKNTLESLENLLFDIIDAIPTLIILAIVFAIITIVKKKRKNKSNKKNIIDETLEIIKEAEENNKDEQ